jgi:hypothetical protein
VGPVIKAEFSSTTASIRWTTKDGLELENFGDPQLGLQNWTSPRNTTPRVLILVAHRLKPKKIMTSEFDTNTESIRQKRVAELRFPNCFDYVTVAYCYGHLVGALCLCQVISGVGFPHPFRLYIGPSAHQITALESVPRESRLCDSYTTLGGFWEHYHRTLLCPANVQKGDIISQDLSITLRHDVNREDKNIIGRAFSVHGMHGKNSAVVNRNLAGDNSPPFVFLSPRDPDQSTELGK